MSQFLGAPFATRFLGIAQRPSPSPKFDHTWIMQVKADLVAACARMLAFLRTAALSARSRALTAPGVSHSATS